MKKQNNGNACENLRNEVLEILERFQEGYTKRDISVVDSYMGELFNKDDVIIIGTSIGEWCLDYDDSKELVQSDWEYWGDVSINADSAIVSDCGDCVWVTVEADIKYQFGTDEAKYDRFIDFVKSYFDDNNANSRFSDQYKIAHINWVLTQVFWNRKDGERTYLWPLRISAVLRRFKGRLLFTEMQFCLPPANEIYPDVRLNFDESMTNDVREGKEKITEYINKTGHKCCGDIESMFNEFKEDYLNTSIGANDIIRQYFTNDENHCVIGYDLKAYQDRDAIAALIEEQRKKWLSMKIEAENTILRVYEATASLAAWGILGNNANKDNAMKMLLAEMKMLLNKETKASDKLFQIQRSIALMFRETAQHRQLDYCFKLEALLVKDKDHWKFSKLQFSFPFYYFFEGMYSVPEIE